VVLCINTDFSKANWSKFINQSGQSEEPDKFILFCPEHSTHFVKFERWCFIGRLRYALQAFAKAHVACSDYCLEMKLSVFDRIKLILEKDVLSSLIC